MAKEIWRIRYTGKDLNDIFGLPCVMGIVKANDQPHVVIRDEKDSLHPGDELVEYDDETWRIEHHAED